MSADVEQQVTLQGRRALARSKGIVRVPLEEMGPALFNRQGAPTSGRHCLNLAKRILTIEGFATYRYTAGYCHEADPKDPEAVARHANQMADRDALLPRLGGKNLKGVFAKTHLVTLLQLYKNGHLPELGAWVKKNRSPEERQELDDVMTYGLFMHVFPWEATPNNKADMQALMASDNFDHGHGLTDSELRCIHAVRSAIQHLKVPQAASQFAVVTKHVQRLSGQRWNEKDMDCFWDFAQTTTDQTLLLLLEVWLYGECEDVLQVDSAFFGAVAKVSALLQWNRTALCVKHFLSDPETECISVGGRWVAGGVDKSTLKRLAAANRSDEQKERSQATEDFVRRIMERYYLPWATNFMNAPFQRDAWAKAFAAFLCKVGNVIAKDDTLDNDHKKKLETKMRITLEVNRVSDMPARVIEDGLEPIGDTREADTVQNNIVLSAKRAAAEAGLQLHSEVIEKPTKVAKTDAQTTENAPIGTITKIDNEGVHVDWGNGKSVLRPLATLVPAPKQKAASQEPASLKLPACKWAVCGTEDNLKMWMNLALTTLYQAYVAQSAAHSDLRVTATPDADTKTDGHWRLYAVRDFKAKTLVLLPWNSQLYTTDMTRPKDAIPVVMTVKPDKEEATCVTFWLRAKCVPKALSSSQDRASVLVPFWTLAAKPDTAKTSVMMYEKIEIPVPTPNAIAKGVRVQKPCIKLAIPVMMNATAVVKGDRLVVGARPPTDLSQLTTEEPDV